MSSLHAEDDLSDAALVRAMASGDQRAIGLLYDRHAPRVMAVALRILRDPAQAEDLVQDVFMESWRKAADFDAARASVSTWLVVRTQSRALDRLRRERRRSAVSLEDLARAERLLAHPERSSRAPDQRALAGWLTRLPEAQREVLELSYFSGLTGSEIAERLGVPLGTVKSRTAAALRALREQLSLVKGVA